jgi:lipoate-protein ligase A
MLGVGDLRVLIYEIPDNPQKSLAFEEAMWRSLIAGIVPDTLRIWRHRNAVILGYFQFAEEEVNFDRAREIGATIVRRFTG